jgi:hypothetical protein
MKERGQIILRELGRNVLSLTKLEQIVHLASQAARNAVERRRRLGPNKRELIA